MTKAQVFPVVLMALNLGAAITYFAQKDARRGLYFLFAAAITATVTF